MLNIAVRMSVWTTWRIVDLREAVVTYSVKASCVAMVDIHGSEMMVVDMKQCAAGKLGW